MYFSIEDHDVLQKYNTTWNKISTDRKKNWITSLSTIFNKEYLKTKRKAHGDEVTDFYNKEIPNVDSNHTCLEIISLDSALKKDDNCYPQVF